MHKRKINDGASDSFQFLSPKRTSLNRRRTLNPMASYNDDDAERRSTRTFSETGQESPMPQISMQEVMNHLDVYIKMFVENKINTKTAWQIQITDYVRVMINRKDKMNMASTSLDIASKVYALRVDDLHAMCLEFASAVNRLDNKNNNDDIDAAQVDDANDENPERNKNKRKKHKVLSANQKSTVAKDPSKLYGEIPKTTTSYSYDCTDNANTSNWCFTNLILDYRNMEFKYLSSENSFITRDCEDKTTNTLYPAQLKEISGKLWKNLGDFQIDEWNPDEQKTGNDIFNEVVLDDQGVPIHELDGSIHDFFNDINQNSEEDEEENVNLFQNNINNNIEEIVDFEGRCENTANDCNYFGKQLMQLWAGPRHWKLKYIKPAVGRFTGNLTSVKETKVRNKSKPKKEDKPLDFDVKHEFLDFSKKLPEKRHNTKLDIDKYTLPMNVLSNMENSYAYGILCKAIAKKNKKDFEAEECNVEPYNYDNLNDSQYCPNGGIDDDNSNGNIEQMEVVDVGNNLIEAPTQVEEIFVGYAKTAKQINVKKLKTTMWNILCDNSVEKKVPEILFKTFYRRLLKEVDSDTASKLNVSIALVAFLHIVNEHHLMLKQDKSNLTNFSIQSND